MAKHVDVVEAVCEYAEGGSTCSDMFNCCDCGSDGDSDCGCAYCWSCNACETCKAENN